MEPFFVIDLISSDEETSNPTFSKQTKKKKSTASNSAASFAAATPKRSLEPGHPISIRPAIGNSSAQATASGHGNHGDRKRNAQDAFGRNGIPELLQVAQAEISSRKPPTQQQQLNSKVSFTPGRTSIENLLARSSEYPDEVESPIKGTQPSKRLRIDEHVKQKIGLNPAHVGADSLASLVAIAEGGHGNGNRASPAILAVADQRPIINSCSGRKPPELVGSSSINGIAQPRNVSSTVISGQAQRSPVVSLGRQSGGSTGTTTSSFVSQPGIEGSELLHRAHNLTSSKSSAKQAFKVSSSVTKSGGRSRGSPTSAQQTLHTGPMPGTIHATLLKSAPTKIPDTEHGTQRDSDAIRGAKAASRKRSPPRPAPQLISQEPVRKSIEVPPPAAFPKTVPLSAASVMRSTAAPNARRFHTSTLSGRAGHPWTDAEMILAAYLHEILGFNWGTIDKKMDRGYNTCNTKYCRVPNGLKNAATKEAMRWPERKRAIDALLSTQDLDMEGMVRYLERYIDTDSLPTVTADEYTRLERLDPYPAPAQAHPISVPVMHDRIVVSESSRTSRASSSDYLTIATRRKRRGVAKGEVLSGKLRTGARLVEGQLDLRMLNRRQDTSDQDTLDSVLVPSDLDDEVPRTLPVPTQQNTSLFGFDAYASEDDDISDLYIQRKLPYLSARERILAQRAISHEPLSAQGWQGTTIHVDLKASEIAALVAAVRSICPGLFNLQPQAQLKGQLQHMLAPATKAQLAAVTVQAAQDQRLRARTRHSIMAFLQDAAAGTSLAPLRNLKIGASVPPLPAERLAVAHHMLHRELGVGLKKSSKLILRDKVYDTMAVTRTWTGASGDVGNLAWSPHGTHFAAGSACLVDPNSMQYNQPNNLLFGNIDQNTLYELPDHHRMRAKPERGVNATHSMHTSQDPRLFETVSMVKFSRDGKQMFSVGYDNHLRSYINCAVVASHNHSAKIDLLAVHSAQNVLATGCHDLGAGVRVFRYSEEGGLLRPMQDLFSSKAQSMLDKKIYPSALQWGVHPTVAQYLLAGFSSSANSELNSQTTHGEVCLWDIVKNVAIPIAPASGNTFDCSWNPRTSHFVTASVASGNVNRGTKSVVRIYNALQDAGGLRWTCGGLEMECPALDINDVLFNPYNDREVVAGATNGTVYVWDTRRPDSIMHRLSHDLPLMELDQNGSREAIDTGVRFCEWGDRAARLHTGSSDGVLKVWDTRRAPEDAHVRDIATFNSGIMSGAFTEDSSKLLIGEVNGSINLLELAADAKPIAELERFTLKAFDFVDAIKPVGKADEDTGAAASWHLWSQGRITYKPMGGYPKKQAVQGDHYDGPYDQSSDAPMLRQRAQAFQKSMLTSSTQCSIPACHDAGRHFAAEIEESERSKDRIPQALRDTLGTQKSGKLPSTLLKCTHCDAPARAREDDTSQAIMPVCERCAFACLRCGKACKKISPAVEVVACRECGSEWDIGVLGYDVQQTNVRSSGTTTHKRGRNLQWAEKEGIRFDEDDGPLNGMGDLFDLVKEYHHSLWEDIVIEEY